VRFISNTIEATSESTPLTVTHVKSQLLCAESLLKDDPIHGQSALAAAAQLALASQAKANPPCPLCTNCRKGPHKAEDCQGKGGGKFGIPFDNQPKATMPTVAYERQHTHSTSMHAFLTSNVKVNANLATHKALDNILIDSGCSCHISPQHDWFETSTFCQLDKPISIDLGDASSIMATGIGTIHLKLDINGNTSYGYIANVLYAERMATTLLSVSDLTKHNHTLTFDNDNCIIKSKTTSALVGIASR
jgi:Pol polyprotein, beta-barrel domain